VAWCLSQLTKLSEAVCLRGRRVESAAALPTEGAQVLEREEPWVSPRVLHWDCTVQEKLGSWVALQLL